MLSTFAASPRRASRVSTGRVAAVINRNVAALQSGPSYWVVLLSGLIEPVLYLLSIGVGVGALVGTINVGGRETTYTAFVAPAMLAVSAMSGALAETTFNFFFKLKYMKTFEAVLATPVRPIEIAIGELVWAIARGSLYTAVFLVVMVVMGLTTPVWALAAFPATVLVGLAFGALGMWVSTLMRGWQDFDLMSLGQFALFLFSGTFFPVQDYPLIGEVLVWLTPLSHAVGLVRDLCMGVIGPALLGHTAYLAAVAVLGLWLASRRLTARLCV